MHIGIRTVSIMVVLVLVGCAANRIVAESDLNQRIRIRSESIRAYNEEAIRLMAEAESVKTDARALAKHPLAPVLRPKLESARAQAVAEVPGDKPAQDAAFRTFVDALNLTPDENKVWLALQTIMVRYQQVEDWLAGMTRWSNDLTAERDAILQEIDRRRMMAAEQAAGAQSLAGFSLLMGALRPVQAPRLQISCTTNRISDFVHTDCR